MTVRLFYKELRPDHIDNAVPVLLLHGLFGSGENLGSQARPLAATRRIVQVDLRNHGQSPHDDFMDLPSMAADVVALLERLDMTRCDIVGHSLGGKVAMQIAMSHADCVRRLVVADIAPVQYGVGHNQVFAALNAVDLQSVNSRRDAEAMMAPIIGEAALRQFLLKGLYRDGELGYRWRFNLAALAANYDALRAAPSGDPFTGPTLFVKGELSDYIADEYQPVMQRLFPAYQLQVIAGAGHWVHGEQPALFNSLVGEFLA